MQQQSCGKDVCPKSSSFKRILLGANTQTAARIFQGSSKFKSKIKLGPSARANEGNKIENIPQGFQDGIVQEGSIFENDVVAESNSTFEEGNTINGREGKTRSDGNQQ